MILSKEARYDRHKIRLAARRTAVKRWRIERLKRELNFSEETLQRAERERDAALKRLAAAYGEGK